MAAAFRLTYAQLASEFEMECWLKEVRLLLASNCDSFALLLDLRGGDCGPGCRAVLSSVWCWLQRSNLSCCVVLADTDAWIAFAAVSVPLSSKTLILDVRVSSDWQEVAREWIHRRGVAG